MCVMTLLDSSVGRSQFRSHKETVWNASMYSLDELLGALTMLSFSISLRSKGFGGEATPFTLVMNAKGY